MTSLLTCLSAVFLHQSSEDQTAGLCSDRDERFASWTEEHCYNRDEIQYRSTFVRTIVCSRRSSPSLFCVFEYHGTDTFCSLAQYTMFNVGEQCLELKKWIHCFES